MNTRDLISYYASRGWHVFPLHAALADHSCECGNPACTDIGKHPKTPNGLKDATTNTETIDGWFAKWPKANWAIRTGAISGVVVLDVDTKNGGDDTLSWLEMDHERTPNTIEVVTGGGGRHIYFTHPGGDIRNSTGKLGAGLDVRGDGGYVCAPPSLHVSGQRYQWESSSLPRETLLAPIPPWLFQLLDTKPTVAPATVDNVTPMVFPEGQRNAKLTSFAGMMRRKGLAEEAIAGSLKVINEVHCASPLAASEIERIAHNVARYAPDEPFPPVAGDEGEPRLTREGDAFIWIWQSLGIGIGFDLLRESYGGLQGEISVQSLNVVGSVDRRGHMHQARFNLSDTGARSKLSSVLAKRRDDLDWETMIEVACYRTVDAWREGEAVADLATGEIIQERRFAVQKLLPKGETTVIYADGGTGKSFLALAVSVAFQTGLSLPCGLSPVTTGNVLVLDWETNEATHRHRVGRIANGLGIPRPHILYRTMRRSIPDDAAHIRKLLTRHQIDLVIVDSLGAACGGEPENAETTLRAFDAMRTFDPATRLVIAHISHAGVEQKNGTSHPFGSRFIRNAARSVWQARKGLESEGTLNIGLFHEKVNEGPLFQPLALTMKHNDAAFSTTFTPCDFTSDPDLIAFSPVAFRLRAALRGGQKTAVDLSQETGIPEPTVRKTLPRLSDVQRMSEGGGRGKSTTWGLKAYTSDDEDKP